MSTSLEAAQAVCQGCCINPGWVNPNPFTNDPLLYQNPQPNYFQPQGYFTSSWPFNNDHMKLTAEEKNVLQKLVEAFNLYTALDKRSEADNKEFTDAIHRLQQIISLRVARRVDPEVWAQPE